MNKRCYCFKVSAAGGAGSATVSSTYLFCTTYQLSSRLWLNHLSISSRSALRWVLASQARETVVLERALAHPAKKNGSHTLISLAAGILYRGKQTRFFWFSRHPTHPHPSGLPAPILRGALAGVWHHINAFPLLCVLRLPTPRIYNKPIIRVGGTNMGIDLSLRRGLLVITHICQSNA